MASLKEQLKSVREGTATMVSLPKRSVRGGRIPAAVFDEPLIEHLSAVGVRELQDALGQLGRLKTLVLSGGELTSLPDAIAELRNLQKLVVTGHALTEVPESVARLPELRVLHLWDNKLERVANAVDVPHLEELNVSRNPLGQLPQSLAEHPSLRHFNASFTKLSCLPNGEGIRELRFARLASAEMSSFPTLLLRCPRLIEIDVSKNAIGELPAELVGLAQLERLFIEGNPIPRVPSFVADLPRLWHLEAYGIEFPAALRSAIRAKKNQLAPNAVME